MINHLVNSYGVHANIFYRRLDKDIQKLKTKYKNCIITQKENGEKYTLNMFYEHHNYLFVLNNMYPFKHPILKINQLDYIDFFMKKNRFYKSKIDFLDIKCPCCYNISCNWTPCLGFIQLLNEYFEYKLHDEEIQNGIFIYNKLGNNMDDLIYKHIFKYITQVKN